MGRALGPGDASLDGLGDSFIWKGRVAAWRGRVKAAERFAAEKGSHLSVYANLPFPEELAADLRAKACGGIGRIIAGDA